MLHQGRLGILHPVDWPEPELACTLASPFWGRGLATEAAAEVRRWEFATLRRNRLVSYILPGNVRSQRVAEKLGAVCGGLARLRVRRLESPCTRPRRGARVAPLNRCHPIISSDQECWRRRKAGISIPVSSPAEV